MAKTFCTVTIASYCTRTPLHFEKREGFHFNLVDFFFYVREHIYVGAFNHCTNANLYTLALLIVYKKI